MSKSDQYSKKLHRCQGQWYNPITPATQEIEAGGLQVGGQLGQLRAALSQMDRWVDGWVG